MPMTFKYPQLMTLGGVALTDENRQPLEETRDSREVRIELASGKIRKFIKEVKRKWSVSWSDTAMDASHTVDGKGGRNELRALAQTGGTMTFQITDGKNTTETYTVFVTSYNEQLLRRRSNTFYYKMNLELEEQG